MNIYALEQTMKLGRVTFEHGAPRLKGGTSVTVSLRRPPNPQLKYVEIVAEDADSAVQALCTRLRELGLR